MLSISNICECKTCIFIPQFSARNKRHVAVCSTNQFLTCYLAQLKFILAPLPQYQYSGLEFSLHNSSLIFVPGFFCQFIVNLFQYLKVCNIKSEILESLTTFSWKIAETDLVRIYSNAAIITCPALFCGQILIMLDSTAKAVVVLMMATSPDLQFVIAVFQQLTLFFPQCIHT